MKTRIRRGLIFLLCLAAVGTGTLLGINHSIKTVGRGRILSQEQAAALGGIDCILVLGCGVREDGKPSDMLRDRLTRGLALYDAGAAPKLLMSGDHGRADYDEVNTMKAVAVTAGVPSADVFMDHAGFSTYESIYRAKEIFEAKRIIIVTQEYHLYRALYLAEKLGLDAGDIQGRGFVELDPSSLPAEWWSADAPRTRIFAAVDVAAAVAGLLTI